MDTGLNLVVNSTAILWWIFLALVWWLYKILIGYKGITTFTFFLPFTFLTNGILVPFLRDLNYQITGIELTSYGNYWWSLGLMYLAMAVGIWLANLLRNPGTTIRSLDRCDVLDNPSGAKWYVLIVLLISAVSLLQIYGSGLAFDFYSYVTLKMDYATYAAHRYGFADATQGWAFFLYNKLPYGIAPLAIILVWNARGLANWKRATFVALLALALLQTGHKMPLVFLVAYMMVSRPLIRWRLVLNTKTMWACAAMFLVVLLGIIPAFYVMQGSDTYGSALFWSAERLFLEQARTLQLYFEVYPNIHPFLHGASTRTVASLMGIADYSPPSIYIPREVLGLEDTSFPSLFIAEGWADFGFIGVFLTSMVVGFLLQSYNVWFYGRAQIRLEETALFLSIVFGTYNLQASNLLTSFFSFGLVGNFLIYLLIRRPHSSRAENSRIAGMTRPFPVPLSPPTPGRA